MHGTKEMPDGGSRQLNRTDRFLVKRMKKESGENPLRSRHCKAEREADLSLEQLLWEGASSDEAKPGDLPVCVQCDSYGR